MFLLGFQGRGWAGRIWGAGESVSDSLGISLIHLASQELSQLSWQQWEDMQEAGPVSLGTIGMESRQREAMRSGLTQLHK